jgi:CheY-like chemotaxis protein
MSELKVFIADDEEPARERLKTLLGDIAVQVPTRVVGEARHGVEAVMSWDENKLAIVGEIVTQQHANLAQAAEAYARAGVGIGGTVQFIVTGTIGIAPSGFR